MAVTNPVPVSGSIQPPTTTLESTSTSSLTVIAVPIPTNTENSVAQLPTTMPLVPRRWRSLDSTTGNIDNGRNVEKEKVEKIYFLRLEIYYVEQELKGAETRIAKLRDELLFGDLKREEEEEEEAEGGESLEGEGERDN
ncbi:hypothetical protein BGAL_0234g00020 [Botrytis galanthina]|uniref:Uncharacterized protein n=1 Tax=Botrytis galanthina TaxID=278940 RepID=A0A4S8QX84_9HELO|nr:hypothetical protein BGAL_0234g00020 [Botrytis galanthina]